MAKVAIIMNCYNGERFLKEAIGSVCDQTFTDWQIIFVNNCSTDRSVEIAESFGDKVKIVTTERTIPLYAARNFGLQHVGDAEYIAFLDVDDLWAPDKLEKQLPLFTEDIHWVYSKVRVINTNGEEQAVEMPKLYRGKVTQQLLLSNFIAISAVLIKASVFKDIQFNADYDLVGDHDMWLRISFSHHSDYVDEFLFFSRRHGDNMTKRNKGKWIKEMRCLYKSLLKTKGFKYPNVILYMVKSELGNLLGYY